MNLHLGPDDRFIEIQCRTFWSSPSVRTGPPRQWIWECRRTMPTRQPRSHKLPTDRPLLYAALLGSKAEATEAIKGLLAKINDDHGNLPHTLYFRLQK